MKNNAYTVIYAAVLGILCAVALTMVGKFTGPFRAVNEQAEEAKNIIDVLEISYKKNASAKDLIDFFAGNVTVQSRGNLRLYVDKGSAGGQGESLVAVPISGQGLWGPIKGFLALNNSLTKIQGITFHHQEETPGLGGEIVSPAFRGRFRGKPTGIGSGKPGIKILKAGSTSRNANEIDGISGATLTCDKVQIIINAALVDIAEGEKR